MFEKQLEQELKKYNKIEKSIFFADVTLSLLIIFLSSRLIKTAFGQASLWMALTLLGIIVILRTFKMFGPKN